MSGMALNAAQTALLGWAQSNILFMSGEGFCELVLKAAAVADREFLANLRLAGLMESGAPLTPPDFKVEHFPGNIGLVRVDGPLAHSPSEADRAFFGLRSLTELNRLATPTPSKSRARGWRRRPKAGWFSLLAMERKVRSLRAARLP